MIKARLGGKECVLDINTHNHILKLEKELKECREWMKGAYHHHECALMHLGDNDCTCGLDELLKGGE